MKIWRALVVLSALLASSISHAQTPTTRASLYILNNDYFRGCGSGCITGTNLNFYNAVAMASFAFLDDANAFTGANSFALSPTGPTPTSASQLATKAYVDASVGGNIVIPQNEILIGNASNLAAPQPLSGDCSLVASGAITCLDTNGTSFGALATLTPGTGIATALALPFNTTGGVAAYGSAATSIGVGSTTITSGTSGDIEYNNSGALGELPTTGSGSVVRATAPAIGTPSSLTLTNATGLPLSGLTGLGTGVATSLADAVNAAGGIVSPTQVRTGDIIYNNAGVWTVFAGNNSGTQAFFENASGTPAWNTVSGSGTVTSLTPGQGITGALGSTSLTPITTTGTLYEDASYHLGQLGGLILKPDGTSPLTVLDTAAGVAVDSTGAYFIKIGAFTKLTGGAWASGTGANGMGNGLTIAASTWYHVCLAYNGGTADEWFDTSVACANKPTGISGSIYRRIGSFKTNASSQILGFNQLGNEFLWVTPVADVPGTTWGTTPTLATLGSVPTGLEVLARLRAVSTTNGILVSSADATSGNTFNTPAGNQTTNATAAATIDVRTNSSAQVYIAANASSTVVNVVTYGWIDTRGQ